MRERFKKTTTINHKLQSGRQKNKMTLLKRPVIIIIEKLKKHYLQNVPAAGRSGVGSCLEVHTYILIT